jgi:hypothetical protein
VEASRARSTDATGRITGAEDDDYGDLLGPLSNYLRGVYERIAGAGDEDSDPDGDDDDAGACSCSSAADT